MGSGAGCARPLAGGNCIEESSGTKEVVSEVSGASSSCGSPLSLPTKRPSARSNHSVDTSDEDTASGGESPVGKRPSTQSSFSSEAAFSSESADGLDKVVRHSGSLAETTVQVRVLRRPGSLTDAYRAFPEVDPVLPAFCAKVDPENLLEQLTSSPLTADRLTLQRLSLAGSSCLAVSLRDASRSQCLRFCICAVALYNARNENSRAVLLQVSDRQAGTPFLACARLTSARKQPRPPWLDSEEDIHELANILLNDDSRTGTCRAQP